MSLQRRQAGNIRRHASIYGLRWDGRTDAEREDVLFAGEHLHSAALKTPPRVCVWRQYSGREEPTDVKTAKDLSVPAITHMMFCLAAMGRGDAVHLSVVYVLVVSSLRASIAYLVISTQAKRWRREQKMSDGARGLDCDIAAVTMRLCLLRYIRKIATGSANMTYRFVPALSAAARSVVYDATPAYRTPFAHLCLCGNAAPRLATPPDAGFTPRGLHYTCLLHTTVLRCELSVQRGMDGGTAYWQLLPGGSADSSSFLFILARGFWFWTHPDMAFGSFFISVNRDKRLALLYAVRGTAAEIVSGSERHTEW